MGIRFNCPNGHKMNVKDFQAGRTGICPVCGVKMRIPHESTRPSSRQEQSSPQGGGIAITEAPEAEPVGKGLGPVFPDMKTGTAPPPIPSTVGAKLCDPLAEGGAVVWYVRPVSGGQYGPAGADVMRAWLAEGRIGSDSFVWREGWQDWQVAVDVFPQLSPTRPIPDIGVVPDLAVGAVHSPSVPERGRLRTRNAQIIAIGSLAFFVVVLFIIFLVVLLKQ
jgi:hypothetical protein